jgi:hypothetical protein
MKVSSAVMAGWCIAVALLPTSAIAGPPFRTDDPEPVDYTHWEFYTFTSGTHISGDTSGVGPAFEFNYGLIPNGQLHIVAPTAFDSPAGGPILFGYGDTEIGFKYRFIEEEKDGSRPQVGIFPLVELPTGNQNKGLGAGHVRVFLPLWVQKSFGDWTTYGGGGYWINQDGNLGDKNYWFFGWLLQRKVTEKLTLGGEIFLRASIARASISAASMTSMNTITCCFPLAEVFRTPLKQTCIRGI